LVDEWHESHQTLESQVNENDSWE